MGRKDYLNAAAAYMRAGLREHLKCEMTRANLYVAFIPFREDKIYTLIDGAFKDFLEHTQLKGKLNTPEIKK